MSAAPSMIDIHAHFLPQISQQEAAAVERERAPWLRIDASGETGQIMVGEREFRPVYRALWDADFRVSELDAQGIALQLVCATPIMFGYAWEPARAADWAARMNDKAVAFCAGHPVGDKDLDHPDLVDFLIYCAENHIPVLVHPWDMMGGAGRMKQWMMPWLVAMAAETQLGMMSLILSGALERIPESLKICFAHGGGSFAYLLGRADNAWKHRDIVRKDCPRPPSEYARRLHTDGIVFDPRALRLLTEVMGVGNVMLGSDYPFPLGEQQVGELVRGADFLDACQRQAILSDNARTFFRLNG